LRAGAAERLSRSPETVSPMRGKSILASAVLWRFPDRTIKDAALPYAASGGAQRVPFEPVTRRVFT